MWHIRIQSKGLRNPTLLQAAPSSVCVCVCDLSLLITLSLLFFSNYGHSYPLLHINTFPLPCLQVTHIDD